MKIRLEENAKTPTRAHDTDAGLDLYAMHSGLLRVGRTATFHTGVHVQLPRETVGLLLPKSGLMVRNDILTFGVIDSGYSGEILVHMFNFGSADYYVQAGDKISQLVVSRIVYEDIEVVDEIEGGERGQNGFGSTGA